MRSSGFTVSAIALVLAVAAGCGEEGASDGVRTTRAPLGDGSLQSSEEVAAPSAARTVDGNPADWFTRVPPFDNMGIVARDAAQNGEYIFIDAAADHRTDLGATAPVDLRRIAITADDDNLYALVVIQGTLGAQIPQVQITVDIDRVTSSGQTFTAGFADTVVTTFATWERLIQTRFAQTPAGSGARVLNTSFTEVGSATAVLGAGTGTIEIGVPWTALGLSGPPQAPLRLTVSSYVSFNASDDTVGVGDPSVSNALDAMGDCADPRSTGFPNAFACDLSDADIDFFADVYFAPSGAVYSPLLVSRFVANGSLTEPDLEWIELRNVSPVSVSFDQVKIGDEETPDTTSQEGMALLPAPTILAPGETFTIAADGAAYQGFYGVIPGAEFQLTSSPAPTVAPYFNWYTLSAGPFQLANTGDQILVLDASNTILDVANWGTGTFTGVTPLTGALNIDDEILVRSPTAQDTDNNNVDFRRAQCSLAAACNDNNPCTDDTCVQSLCVHTNNTATCDDGQYCNGMATCSGGACVPGTPPACPDDGLYCNGLAACDEATDSCVPGTPPSCPDDGLYCNGAEACDEATDSCGHITVPSCPSDGLYCNGVEACDETTDSCAHVTPPVCPDANLCNGVETCDEATDSCAPGTPVTCTPLDQCHAAGTCNPSSGACSNPPANDGTPCSGGACVSGICVPGGGGGASGGGGMSGGGGAGGAGIGGAGAGAGGAGAGAGGAGAGGAGAGGAGAGGAGAGGAGAGAAGASGVGGGAGASGGAGAGGVGGGDGGGAGANGGEAGEGVGGDDGVGGEDGTGGDGVGGSGAVAGSSGRGGSGGAATGGVAGDSAGATGEGGESDSGGSGGGADEDSGCGCAVPGRSGEPLFPALVFALFVLGSAMRRGRVRNTRRVPTRNA